MAATAIALTKIPLNGGVELPAAAALDGTAGAEIQFDGQDTKIVILIENGGSAAGDGERQDQGRGAGIRRV